MDRTAALPTLAGAALLYAGSSFVVPSSQSSAGSVLRANIASNTQDVGVPSTSGATKGAAVVAACGFAAAAGVAAFSRRRSAVTARAEQWGNRNPPAETQIIYCPELAVNWQVEPKFPVPGSQKALESMVGADVEINEGQPWDPMGFSKLYDRNFDFDKRMTWPHVQWLREAEIKHGRICMLAFVGMVVQQFGQIPGYPLEPDWTKALAACYESKVATLGVVQISIFAFIMEGKFSSHDAWIGQMDREPGDLGFDPLKLSKRQGFDMKTKQVSELKNGRLAMIGVASLAANHAIPGSVPFLTGSYAVAPEAQDGGGGATLCGSTHSKKNSSSKTAARYTTQVILPALTWLKTGIKASELAPRQLIAKTIGGNDVLVGKDEDGQVFCVANLCPHIGTPMSEGADVVGDIIVCPLHGSSFSTKTGELYDWCPSPPIIGPLTGLVVDKKTLLIFDSRTSFFGGEVEVLVDTNAKKAYEADYWKGILDAQGKNDGTWY